MTKMPRPVMKRIAETNFKNWDRLDKIIGEVSSRLENTNEDYVFYLSLAQELEKVRNDIKFIDETFRVWLEEK